MTSWRGLALGCVFLGIATATVVVPYATRDTRSSRPVLQPSRNLSTRFDRRQSAALFVGVRHFDNVEYIPFAADDAVDLAYVFALERRVSLVPPRRVVLVLSGRPVKKESIGRLAQLRDAGADVRFRATADDIVAALREQAALAGRDGMLVVSVASHGLLRDGDGYILGTSSVVRDRFTMLPLTRIFETIASSAAQRSVVFVDACRERISTDTRAVLSDVMSAAPVAKRLSRTRGQVVFYAAAAGRWAYDDPDTRNGVFTKAVISGINCGAPTLRGFVTADTLARYVERTVHSWVAAKKDPNIGSATQSDIDGEARNMPLARCGGASLAGPARASRNGTSVRAFSDGGAVVWERNVGVPVMRAEAVDLDADGWREVVYATQDTVAALNDAGSPLWSAREPMHLEAFVSGDLFRHHTNEVVALWSGEAASRLAIYASDGALLGRYDSERRLDRITIARATNRHAPRIVATSGNIVLVFDPKKLAAGKPLWAGRVSRESDSIASLEIADCNGDGRNEIGLTTASGARVFVDFNGHAIRSRSSAHFARVAPKRIR